MGNTYQKRQAKIRDSLGDFAVTVLGERSDKSSADLRVLHLEGQQVLLLGTQSRTIIVSFFLPQGVNTNRFAFVQLRQLLSWK